MSKSPYTFTWSKPEWLSVAILEPPRFEEGKWHRGAMILNQIDTVVAKFPNLPQRYYLIERRGWYGMNASRFAHIKLVEDTSTLDDTKAQFPGSILLPIGPADFVDHEAFQPVSAEIRYDVMQVACWSTRKRIELMIDAAARIPHMSFLHLAHFENGGSAEEFRYRDWCLKRIQASGANITVPYSEARSNRDIPVAKEQVNAWINQSRIGLLTTAIEGINRFKMECLAANRPVLVSADACVPTRKHINAQTGGTFPPYAANLAKAVTKTLDELHTFSPRQYLLEHTGKARSLALLKDALREWCRRLHEVFHFDAIDWDGRNQSLTWGVDGMKLIEQVCSHAPAKRS